MYSLLGKELHLWIGVILIMGRLGYRSFLYPGHIRLGNRPHMLDYGPHLSPWDVLSLGRFVPWKVLSLGTFCPWDVLTLRTFCPLVRFVPWDVLSLGMFCP